jgi:cytochrome c oxidase subunit II
MSIAVFPRMKGLPKWFAAALGLALGASACAPNPPTKEGLSTNHLYYLFSYIALVVFVLVLVLVGWCIFKYRQKKDDDGSLPEQTSKNVPIEIIYFAVPQLLVVFMFFASLFVLHNVNAEPSQVSGKKALVIDVTGFQWGWDFDYKDAGVTLESQPHVVATFYLPTDTPIRFRLHSDDVVHSFFIPDFMMKRDVIPGVNNSYQISGIERTGRYRIQCAEFCGLLHDRMYAYIKAVSPSQFQSWLSSQSGSS